MTIRAFAPSTFTTYSIVCPFCLTEKAMRLSSRAMAGPPMIRVSGALHSSVALSLCSFQILSLAPLEETYSRYPVPSLGEDPLPVVSGMRRADDVSACAPVIGNAPERPFWTRKCRHQTLAVGTRRKRGVPVDARGHAARDAPVNVEAVDPRSRTVRVTCEVQQRPRVQENRVAHARVVIRYPFRRSSGRPDAPDVHLSGSAPWTK